MENEKDYTYSNSTDLPGRMRNVLHVTHKKIIKLSSYRAVIQFFS